MDASGVPLVGLGTFNDWKDPDSMAKAVEEAIQIGYRHIDCAAMYDNEPEIGQVLTKAIANGVPREDLFIVSKLPNACHHPDTVRPRLQQTLDDLGIAYLDLYLIHWPEAWAPGSWVGTRGESGKGSKVITTETGASVYYDLADIPLLDTWTALEACVDAGLCKRIGVSNFRKDQLQLLLDNGRIKPYAHEFELHPYLTLKSMVAFCKQNNIHVTAYSSLGRGWHKGSTQPELMKEPVILQVAQETGRSPGQVLLRWATQQGISVIPKSLKARLEENFKLDFDLSADQMAAIDGLNQNLRFVTPSGHVFDKDE